MEYPKDFLDVLRDRASMVALVSQATKLRPNGRDEWIGLCPFHAEKTPSFTLNENKGFYHCFGCKASGDIFHFLQKQRGMDFSESVQFLAKETGVEIPQRLSSARVSKQEELARSLRSACAAAARWYQSQLAQFSPARSYLEGRGLKKRLQEEFLLGYAPRDGSLFLSEMERLGFDKAQLEAAGLCRPASQGRPLRPTLQDRLIFPIHSSRGDVIAFGGRTLQKESLGQAKPLGPKSTKPKYLNTPNTLLFRKGATLYNLHRARQFLGQKKTLLVVEGYTDVLALSSAGFGHAVAPLGTALTEDHLRLLWKLVDEPTICLDGDTAGSLAAKRLCERAMPLISAGKSLSFVFLPQGEDPDSLLRKEGKPGLQERLAQSVPLVRAVWLLASHPAPQTPEKKAQLHQDLRTLARRIPDKEIGQDYENLFASWSKELSSTWRRERTRERSRERTLGQNAGTQENAAQRSMAQGIFSSPPKGFPQQDLLQGYLLLTALFHHPVALAKIIEEVAKPELSDPPSAKLHSRIVEALAQPEGTSASMQTALEKSGLAKAMEKVLAETQGHGDYLKQANMEESELIEHVREILWAIGRRKKPH